MIYKTGDFQNIGGYVGQGGVAKLCWLRVTINRRKKIRLPSLNSIRPRQMYAPANR